MKKIAILMLCLSLLLCGCGGSAPAETTAPKAPAETTAPAQTTAPVETTVPETTAHVQTTEPETEEETDPVDEARVLAESCIDKSVEELYKLIGEPDSADYAPSCLDENGEDGILYYENFIVYTYREGDNETVSFVE